MLRSRRVAVPRDGSRGMADAVQRCNQPFGSDLTDLTAAAQIGRPPGPAGVTRVMLELPGRVSVRVTRDSRRDGSSAALHLQGSTKSKITLRGSTSRMSYMYQAASQGARPPIQPHTPTQTETHAITL